MNNYSLKSALFALSLSFACAFGITRADAAPSSQTRATSTKPESTANTPASIAFECKSSAGLPELQIVLNEVQQNYKSSGTVSAHFDQDSYLAALNTAESSSGTVLFKKPGLMRWDYSEPETQQFILRDHTVWLYQPEIKQVLVDELTQLLLTDLPVSFLMGVGDLKAGFDLKGGCKTSLGTVLILHPKQTNATGNSLKNFKLLVSPSNVPAGAQIFDVTGNVTTIALKAIKTDAPIDDSEFVTKYPSGTDVNDRRNEKRG